MKKIQGGPLLVLKGAIYNPCKWPKITWVSLGFFHPTYRGPNIDLFLTSRTLDERRNPIPWDKPWNVVRAQTAPPPAVKEGHGAGWCAWSWVHEVVGGVVSVGGKKFPSDDIYIICKMKWWILLSQFFWNNKILYLDLASWVPNGWELGCHSATTWGLSLGKSKHVTPKT